MKRVRKTIIHWAGCDVSKHTFDAGFVLAEQKFPATKLSDLPAEEFDRTRKGAASFLDWLDRLTAELEKPFQVRVVMEATGKYSTELAMWLIELRPSLSPAIDPLYLIAMVIEPAFAVRLIRHGLTPAAPTPTA